MVPGFSEVIQPASIDIRIGNTYSIVGTRLQA